MNDKIVVSPIPSIKQHLTRILIIIKVFSTLNNLATNLLSNLLFTILLTNQQFECLGLDKRHVIYDVQRNDSTEVTLDEFINHFHCAAGVD